MSQVPIRVVIVDNHALMRKAVASLLEREEDIEVVGEAGCCEDEVYGVIDEVEPNLVLLDLDATCATEAYLRFLQYLHMKHPSVRVVVMTEHREQDCTILNPKMVGGMPWIPENCCLHQSFRAGARGAVRKNCRPEELARVLRAVHGGEYAFERKVETQVLHTLMGRRQEQPKPALTSRERQIVQLLTEGRSNKQIGCMLGIREQTVKNYVSRLLEKMDLEDRVQLAVYALKHNLVDASTV